MSSQITLYTSTRIFVRTFRVNTVAAIDCFSRSAHGWIWFVGLGWAAFCDSISVYNGPSPKEGERKREKIDERQHVQTNTIRTYSKRNRPLPYIIQINLTTRISVS